MFYIFLVSVINLGLGFAAAMHLRSRHNSLSAALLRQASASPSNNAVGSASITMESHSDVALAESCTDDADGNQPTTANGKADRSDKASCVSVGPSGDHASTLNDQFASDLDALFA